MNNTKVCKQCGRDLFLHLYRNYYPRGVVRSRENANVGRNTICKECEAFNAKINRTYRLDIKSFEQVQELEQAAAFYKYLHSKGLEPKGRYAADVLGLEKTRTVAKSSYMDRVMASLDSVVCKGQELLDMDLTDEPDVYQGMLDEWRETILGDDGKVIPEYLNLFNQVAAKVDDYEDNYEW